MSRRAPPAAFARAFIAFAVLAAASYGLVAPGEAADRVAGLVASWQLFPGAEGLASLALGAAGSLGLSGAVLVLVELAISTLAGRWYCSALCPLGGLQDLASTLGGRRLRYRRGRAALRWAVAVAALVLVSGGATALASWLDPWSSFGRFAAYAARPLARLASRADIPGFDYGLCAVSVAVMAGILVMAALRGRWFCGHLCPVGTILGGLNSLSPLRLRLDPSACISCGRCEAVCVGACIRSETKVLDESRCVYCLSCLAVCPRGALRYGPARPARTGKTGEGGASGAGGNGISRSRFLATLGGGVLALAVGDLGLGRHLPRIARIGGRVEPFVAPPGAMSLDRLSRTCTGCGLCVARCPSGVLQPGGPALGALGAYIPVLDHSLSYCQYDCTVCMDVCPSGALGKLDLPKKKLTKIGNSTLVRERCIVFTQGTRCGACAEHCPTGAVRMVPGPSGLPEPVFSSDICIGCGACHYACPVRPRRAISVSGLSVHEEAMPPAKDLFSLPAPAAPADGSGDFPF